MIRFLYRMSSEFSASSFDAQLSLGGFGRLGRFLANFGNNWLGIQAKWKHRFSPRRKCSDNHAQIHHRVDLAQSRRKVSVVDYSGHDEEDAHTNDRTTSGIRLSFWVLFREVCLIRGYANYPRRMSCVTVTTASLIKIHILGSNLIPVAAHPDSKTPSSNAPTKRANDAIGEITGRIPQIQLKMRRVGVVKWSIDGVWYSDLCLVHSAA